MSEKKNWFEFTTVPLDSRWLVNLPECCEHHSVLEVEVVEWSPDTAFVKLFRVADGEDVWYPVGDVNVLVRLGDHPGDTIH